jgi:hypothetical protein
MVVMRDGVVVTDSPVSPRMNAKEELQAIDAAHHAAQLIPSG